MFKQTGVLLTLLLALPVASRAGEPVPPGPAPVVVAAPAKKTVVYVIPVQDEINRPILYILRRGLKEADQKADAVVLDMNTPGCSTTSMETPLLTIQLSPALVMLSVDV